MKLHYLILVVFVLGCVLLPQVGCRKQTKLTEESKAVPAEQPTKTEIAPQAKQVGPRITFEKVVHNFGDVGPGTKNLCEFKFTNTGDALLKITKVSKTCGCTPFTLDKKEYAPGESGVLKVAYRAARRPGSPTKYLFVDSNDKTKSRVKLTIRATIARKVSYEPKILSLSLLQEEPAQIKLTSLDGRPFSILQLSSTAGCITADYDPSVEATGFILEAKVDTEKLRKHLNGLINIKLNHPECDMVTIPFQALAEFEVSPPSIIVLDAEPNEPSLKEVWVLSNYDSDFEVEAVSSKKGIVKVVSQEKIGRRYKFELEITPPVPEDNQRVFADVFYVYIKGGARLEVNCRGFYSKK